jgi:putative SOS response-associated peptidase YedK
MTSLDALRWGLIPYWCKDPGGGRKPINAKSETVDRCRRSGTPTASVDASCLSMASSNGRRLGVQKAKQPYAIAMKDGAPFGIGGIWENWKELRSGEWIRTFAVITTPANGLVAEIHDRMPLILASCDYERWLSEEPVRPFPAEPMRMWPISTRVNKLENDDPSILDPVEWRLTR